MLNITMIWLHLHKILLLIEYYQQFFKKGMNYDMYESQKYHEQKFIILT